MNKYNPEELKAAIKAALDRDIVEVGMFSSLYLKMSKMKKVI